MGSIRIATVNLVDVEEPHPDILRKDLWNRTRGRTIDILPARYRPLTGIRKNCMGWTISPDWVTKNLPEIDDGKPWWICEHAVEAD